MDWAHGFGDFQHTASSEIIGCLWRILFEKTEIEQKHPLSSIPLFRGPAEEKTQKGRMEGIVKAD